MSRQSSLLGRSALVAAVVAGTTFVTSITGMLLAPGDGSPASLLSKLVMAWLSWSGATFGLGRYPNLIAVIAIWSAIAFGLALAAQLVVSFAREFRNREL